MTVGATGRSPLRTGCGSLACGSLWSLPAAALRGGNWDNGTDAGLFAVNLNNGPSNWNTNNGFRCCRSSAYIHGSA